ncbi:hypothetical protein KAFR_0J02950 [Kazachstania africana CBS 2517]|uniref:DNA 3'-5' helicase n=1 Tax=Kazachstania africana (strain ATCC 22294 / BCRC 22015 / CBS 2517 / CECT 1963 / NBRC 1671 / NRRL Y-8276) TaxID=1071382 RepID=H2B159_KAZAF|nr:hypothetical protein KAFR_0J02950 [Kazachstania africana CBS 2517]CCF60359.1 hypothetical protein KAFR_0J02950 [Kazachstania africana CBS 2517]
MGTKFDALGGSGFERHGKRPQRKKSKRNDQDKPFKISLSHNPLLDDEYGSDESYSTNTDTFLNRSNCSDDFSIDQDDTQISHDVQFKNDDFINNNSKRRLTIKKKHELTPTSVLPDSSQNIFQFTHFNRMQSESFKHIYECDNNCVISSPTGSGKTVLFELAILQLLRIPQVIIENLKILYIAPTKSLCSEIFNKWNNKFINFSVGMLTSDTSFLETDKVKKSNIIITTPEKWDLMTRKWKDYSRLFELFKLILIDEIHILGENRGATLEVVITRMSRMCRNIRIIAVSATIPNSEDIGKWLNSPKASSLVLKFDDSYRQVQLKKYVCGYTLNCKNDFQKDVLYNSKLMDIIEKYGRDKPILVFCPTRASTISTSKYLSQNSPVYGTKGSYSRYDDKLLNDCTSKGIAFHNAGLSLKDRTLVENEFINGKIKILCSTSTLAIGVNLPAYLVIIKGTRMWNISETKEYSNLEILQMVGRAGRPQFENEGCAVIMTDFNMKSIYENLVSGNDILESKLHLNLIEHLCSEISLGTVSTTANAIAWLKSTFFYVRFMKNRSSYYQLNRFLKRGEDAEAQLTLFCQSLLDNLLKEQLIEYNEASFRCTSYGHAMVRHYISFETMKTFLHATDYLGVEDVLKLLVTSKEFEDIRIRQNERKLYKEINLSPLIRYPYFTQNKQSQIIDKTSQKVSLIIQYELGGLEFPSFDWAYKLHQTLVQDKMRTFKHCYRLLKCLTDMFIERKDGPSLESTLYLLRSVNGNCWEDSAAVLRQLKTIGLVSVRKLLNHGVTTLEDLGNLMENQIEYYLGLNTGAGNKIKKDVSLLPLLNIRGKLDYCSITTENSLDITFKVEVSASFKSSIWHGNHLSLHIIIFSDSGLLIDFRRIQLSQLEYPRSFKINCVMKSKTDKLKFAVHCQEVAGIGKEFTFTVTDLPTNYASILSNSADNMTSANRFSTVDTFGSESDNLSLSSDDIIFTYLAEKKAEERDISGKNVSSPKLSTGRKLMENGNYQCNHTCKDRKRCRHLCCKEGIPKESIKLRKNAAITGKSKNLSEHDALHRQSPIYRSGHEAVKLSNKRLPGTRAEEWHEDLGERDNDVATVQSQLLSENGNHNHDTVAYDNLYSAHANIEEVVISSSSNISDNPFLEGGKVQQERPVNSKKENVEMLSELVSDYANADTISDSDADFDFLGSNVDIC